MITVEGRPCNGVDTSHWGKDPVVANLLGQNWLKFYGHKATHVGSNNMTAAGVDPKFASRRLVAEQLDIRWRAFFMWVVPSTVASPAVQVETLCKAIGELKPGESVYLDWEDVAVTRKVVDEIMIYMDLEFKGRWFMYANDINVEMTTWLQENSISKKVPLMHPNWNLEKGLQEALKWDATIWQVLGEATPPGFSGPVSVDYVLKPDLLDKVCGLS